MDIHRYGNVVTVVLHGVGHFLVEQRVPLFGLGHILEHIGVEQAGGRPVLDVGAFDLRDTGRVACDGAAFQHGHGRGTTTTGDSAVLPGEAVFLDLRLEHIDRRLFTARGPPVHDLDTAFGFGSRSPQRK
ncbi:hypothetical protein D3C79_938890 [compost metagenome]